MNWYVVHPCDNGDNPGMKARQWDVCELQPSVRGEPRACKAVATFDTRRAARKHARELNKAEPRS